MAYIRHDENCNPVPSQPGKTIRTQFSGNEGWSTVTYEDFNADYVRHDENCNPVPVNTIGTYQRHDENCNPVPANTIGTYQRHDENNNPVSGGGLSSPSSPRIVVGSIFDDDNGSASGSAYIYNLDGTGEVKVTASDGASGDRLGISVAVGSNKIVVGAYTDDDDGSNSGSVYVYNIDGTNEVKLTASDAFANDIFGRSVSIGSNKIVVGAPGNDDDGTSSGSAYIYNLDGTNEVKLTASDGAQYDEFGISVAVGNDKVVVGAYGDDDNGSTSGSVYVYNLDGTGETKIIGSDTAAGDSFGNSVAIGNNKLVVGSPYDDDNGSSSGSVYVYNLDGTGEVKITASDAAAGDNFGFSVAVGSNKIVVGSISDDTFGSAYIYNLDGTGEVKITASDAAQYDQFGYSVGVSNDKVVVGARGDDNVGSSSGSAYIYNLDGTGEVKITASDAADSDLYGTSVAIG